MTAPTTSTAPKASNTTLTFPTSNSVPPLLPDPSPPVPAPTFDLSLQITAPKLALAQRQFDQLVVKVERLTQRLAETQAIADTHRPRYHSRLQPLVAQSNAAAHEMVRWLDARVQQNGLTPTMLRGTKAMLCALSEGLALAGNAAMRALHDRYSRQSLADKQQAVADDMQNLVQRMAGVHVGDRNPGKSARAAKKQAKARAQHVGKPRSAAQITAHTQQQDAQGVLRTIYRQLASALHPDRERDEGEHVRKTKLMGQVNAAYQRRDLMALLTLQLCCDQPGTTAIWRLTTEKMTTLTRLLQAQAAAVEQDLVLTVSRVHQEFALSPDTLLTEEGLTLELDNQAFQLQTVLASMHDDLQTVQSDTGLKRWLKKQAKISRLNGVGPDFDGLFR